jgi:hypothetical protein
MIVDSIEALETIYGNAVPPAATAMEKDHLIAPYVALIEASPFFALSTVGPEGADCSARGDEPGFARVADQKTIMFPDRRGNNKIDSLRNIVRDPRVALMFLIPGTGMLLRVNGTAQVSVDPALRESFTMAGAVPKSVVVVKVEKAYMQCARALLRSHLWDPGRHVDPASLPTTGDILSYVTNGEADGKQFDQDAPSRMAGTLW